MRKRKKWSPNGYLFAAFRKIWRWCPERRECLEAGKVGLKYSCNGCKGRFKREDVAVDHKEPVVDPSKGFETWQVYFNRLFVPVSKMQLLCKTCHKEKSKEENKIRRQRKGA